MAGSSLLRTTFSFSWLWKWRKQGCHGQQLRLVWQHQLHWLPPWYRKILHCQLQYEQGVCEKRIVRISYYWVCSYQIMQGYDFLFLTKTTKRNASNRWTWPVGKYDSWYWIASVVRLISIWSLFRWLQMQLVRNLVSQKETQSGSTLKDFSIRNVPLWWTWWTQTPGSLLENLYFVNLMKLKTSAKKQPTRTLGSKSWLVVVTLCSREEATAVLDHWATLCRKHQNLLSKSSKRSDFVVYQTTKYKQTSSQYRSRISRLIWCG